MQEWYLGWEMVSCLERYFQFSGVLIERERFKLVDRAYLEYGV